MSLERWLALRPGDIIRSKRSGVNRIVLRSSDHGGIQLKMLRSSWRFPCPITTYVKGDRYLFKYTGRRVKKVPVVRCHNKRHPGFHERQMA